MMHRLRLRATPALSSGFVLAHGMFAQAFCSRLIASRFFGLAFRFSLFVRWGCAFCSCRWGCAISLGVPFLRVGSCDSSSTLQGVVPAVRLPPFSKKLHVRAVVRSPDGERPCSCRCWLLSIACHMPPKCNRGSAEGLIFRRGSTSPKRIKPIHSQPFTCVMTRSNRPIRGPRPYGRERVIMLRRLNPHPSIPLRWVEIDELGQSSTTTRCSLESAHGSRFAWSETDVDQGVRTVSPSILPGRTVVLLSRSSPQV